MKKTKLRELLRERELNEVKIPVINKENIKDYTKETKLKKKKSDK